MYTIKTLNAISPVGLAKLPANQFEIDNEAAAPQGILVRSADMHDAHRPMVFAISWWASVVLAYNSLMVAVMGCMRIRLTGVYTASTTAASTTTTITARQPHGTCHAAPK